MFTLKKITHTGVSFARNAAEGRSIVVSNYISLVFFGTLFILVWLIFYRLGFDYYTLFAVFLYLVPVLLNSLGFIVISRVYQSWMPSLLLVCLFSVISAANQESQTSIYDGFRIYLLGCCCIPFLLFDNKNKLQFIIYLSLPALTICFADQILILIEKTFSLTLFVHDTTINQPRTIIAFFLIGGSCFSLKWLVEKSEAKNEQLIIELAEKNEIIQKQATEQIQETTSRLAMATDSAGVGIWEWDLQTDHVILDKQTCNLFGVEYNSDKKIEWRDIIHSEDYEDLINKLNESIANQKDFKSEFRIALPNGDIKHLYSNAGVYYHKGVAARMIGVCWDITDEKNSEQQLQHSEANLNAIINSTNFFIWSVNRNYELRIINKPFKKYIKKKYNADVNEGESVLSLYNRNIIEKEFSTNFVQHYRRALAGESFELTEIESNRHFKYSFNPIIENAMVTGVSVFEEETTELRTKEEELREANKQISDSKLMALRAAMNPHFVFNTLNSIQYFIMEKDQLNAVNYLSTFSKLIRSILNNSVHSRIQLGDELDQIKYYVQLELLRFENKFEFNLNIDEEVDIDNIEIPSMLIQPYLENAILHGLYNKSDKGLLTLSVKERGDSILFEIEDNGVGRAAASNFKLNLPSHKSYGMLLTEERLKLINAHSGISSTIEDLEVSGKPAGTRVKIWIKA